MTRAMKLSIISIMITPLWAVILLLKPEDMYIALATFIEVCSIGAFSLGASQVIDYYVHPGVH